MTKQKLKNKPKQPFLAYFSGASPAPTHSLQKTPKKLKRRRNTGDTQSQKEELLALIEKVIEVRKKNAPTQRIQLVEKRFWQFIQKTYSPKVYNSLLEVYTNKLATGSGSISRFWEYLKNAIGSASDEISGSFLISLFSRDIGIIRKEKREDQGQQVRKKKIAQGEKKAAEDIQEVLQQITQDPRASDVSLLLLYYFLMQWGNVKDKLPDEVIAVIANALESGSEFKSPNRNQTLLLQDNLNKLVESFSVYTNSLTQQEDQDGEGGGGQEDISDTSLVQSVLRGEDCPPATYSLQDYIRRIEAIEERIEKNSEKKPNKRQIAFLANAHYALWKNLADNPEAATSLFAQVLAFDPKDELPILPDSSWYVLLSLLDSKKDRFSGLAPKDFPTTAPLLVKTLADQKKALSSFDLSSLSSAAEEATEVVNSGRAIERSLLEDLCIALDLSPPIGYFNQMKFLSSAKKVSPELRHDDFWAIFGWEPEQISKLPKERVPNPLQSTAAATSGDDASSRLLLVESLLSSVETDTLFDNETVQALLDFVLQG